MARLSQAALGAGIILAAVLFAVTGAAIQRAMSLRDGSTIPRCGAPTLRETPCRNLPRAGQLRCWRHRPAYAPVRLSHT